MSEDPESAGTPRGAIALSCLVTGTVALQFLMMISNVVAQVSTGGNLPSELLVAPDPASDAVSATAAEFRVDESGAATYSIPLYAVPGTAGVTPKLSLHYSSQGGEGPVGKGWSIGGLSSITRCRATREAGDFLGAATPDGNPAPINFSASDRFCLDGQRLVPSPESCPSVGGLGGTAFATEIETFQRVCAYAGTNGPAFFTVERKDGSKSWYGNREDENGALRNDGVVNSTAPGHETAVLSWSQVRFQDSAGNYVDYRYTNGGTDNPGEHLLDAVRYTGKVGGGQPYAEIRFTYDVTRDQLAYVSGGLTRSRGRLVSVTSSVDHDGDGSFTDARHYALGYGIGLMTMTLTSLRECNNRNLSVCAEPTTFEWSTNSVGPSISPFETHEQTGTIPNGSLSKFEGFKFADVDGDGRQDFVWIKDEVNTTGCPELVYVAFSRFNAQGNMYLTVGNPVMCTPQEIAPNPKDQSWFLLDYNGDGRDDIFFRKNGGWVGNPSTGDYDYPFATNVNLLSELSQPIPPGARREDEPQQSDLNGDGLIDLVYQRNGALIARIMERGGSYGFRWGAERAMSLTGECGTNCYLVDGFYRKNNYLQLNDFNGDSRSDLLITISNPNGCGGGGGGNPPEPPDPGGPVVIQSVSCPVVAPFVVQTITSTTVTLMQYGYSYFSVNGRTTFADVNGDGLTDPIFHGLGTPYPSHTLNTGAGFSGQHIPNYGTPGPINTALLQIADINNDGRADMLYPAGSNNSYMHVRYGTPSGAFGGAVQLDQALSGCADRDCAGRTHIFSDLDGDGNTDYMRIVWSNSSYSQVLFSRAAAQRRHVPRNVITRIRNGFGAITDMKYGSLNNRFLHSADAGSRNTAVWGRGSPVQDLHAPMHVVSRASSSSPVPGDPNAMATVHYRYVGAKIQAGGRGFLGFREIETIDPNQSDGYVVTTTSYLQAFPYTGMPIKTVKRAAPGGSYTPHSCLDTVVWDGCFASAGTPLPQVDGHEFSNKLQSWEPEPANLAIQAPIPLRIAGTDEVLRDPMTSAATSRVATAFTYGSHGNVLQTVVDTFTGADTNPNTAITVITQNQYAQDDVARWRLGRLTRTTVTHRRPQLPDVVRVSSFDYGATGSTAGMLTHERTQPGSNIHEDLLKVHGLDSYGNRTSTTSCSNDVAACVPTLDTTGFQPTNPYTVHRYSRMQYDARGRFPVYAYEPFWNGTGASERVTRTIHSRNIFGDVVHASDINEVHTYAVNGALGRPYYTWVQTSGNTTLGEPSGGVESLTTYDWCSSVACPDGGVARMHVVAEGAPRQWTYLDVLGRTIMKASQTFNIGVGGQDVSAVCTLYDRSGKPTHVSLPFFLPGTPGNSGPTSLGGLCWLQNRQWTSTTYDVLGRPVRVTAPDTTYVDTSYNGLETTVTDHRRRMGQVTRQLRNGKGELVFVRDAVSTPMGYYYRADGSLWSVHRDAGRGVVANSFVNDSLGRKVEQHDPDSGNVQYSYNAMGEIVVETRADGSRIEQDYDARGRVWRKTARRAAAANNAIESRTAFVYDTQPYGLGQLSGEAATGLYGGWADGGATQLSLAFTRGHTYDMFGRPSFSETRIDNTHVYPARTQYDALGRPYRSQDASGRWTQTEFNARGFVAAICNIGEGDAVADCGGREIQRTHAIDVFGHTTSEFRSATAQIPVTRQYNAVTGRIERICADKPGNNGNCDILDEGYNWDGAGNLLVQVKEGRYRETFHYDLLNRLTHGYVGPWNQETLGYWANFDAFGNVCLKSQGNANTHQHYFYGGLSGCGLGDTANSPHGVAYANPAASAHRVIGTGSTSYGYDGRGNQILRDAAGTAQDRHIAYSIDDRAYAINRGGGVQVTRFWYGSDGSRYKREDLGERITHYVGNVEIVIAGGVTSFKRNVGGVLLQTIVAGTAEDRYLFHDQLGNLVRMTDASGTRVADMDFVPSGERRNFSDPFQYDGVAPAQTTRGFTGHETIDGMSIIHMNGRIYDPEIGRFLQPDPLIQAPDNAQSWNAYTYVFNNPLRYTDPTGMLGEDERMWAAAIVAIAASVWTGGASMGWWAGAMTGAQIAGVAAAAGFAAGAIATKSWQGGLMGAFTAVATAGLGGGGGGFSFSGWAVQTFAGGVVGSLQGGDFGHAFLSAGLTAAFMPAVGQIGNDVARIAVGALVGGSISELTGGKFASGAVSGAVQAAMMNSTSAGNDDELQSDVTSDGDWGLAWSSFHGQISSTYDPFSNTWFVRGSLTVDGAMAASAATILTDSLNFSMSNGGERISVGITFKPVANGGDFSVAWFSNGDIAQLKKSGYWPVGGRMTFGSRKLELSKEWWGYKDDTIPHEFGHGLGLRHAPAHTRSTMEKGGLGINRSWKWQDAVNLRDQFKCNRAAMGC